LFSTILEISPRGQITIPKVIRVKMGVKRLNLVFKDNQIILEPMQTREEFFEEIEAIQKDLEINGGTPLEEVNKI
jgi:AbrB family looped-hinge helix DNA binding protein